MTDYSAILDVYTLEDIFELNDLASEDALRFMVEEEFLSLPNIKPLDFDE